MSNDRFFSEDNRAFPDIRVMETTDDLLGGDDGQLNIAPRQLAHRTDYLNSRVESVDNNKLGISEKAADSSLLNGLPASSYITEEDTESFVKRNEVRADNYIVNSALHRDCWQKGSPCSVLPTSNFLSADYGPDQYLVYGTGGTNLIEMRLQTQQYENQKVNLCYFDSDNSDNTEIKFGNIFECDNLSSGGLKNFSMIFDNPPYSSAFTPKISIFEINNARSVVRTILSSTMMPEVPSASGVCRINIEVNLLDAIEFSEGNAVYIQVTVPARNFSSIPMGWGGFQLTDGQELRPFYTEEKARALIRCKWFFQEGYMFNGNSNYGVNGYHGENGIWAPKMRKIPSAFLHGGASLIVRDSDTSNYFIYPSASTPVISSDKKLTLDARY